MKLDYADWLTPARLTTEEGEWARGGLYQRYGAAIRRLLEQEPSIRTITEFGCGTGWVPTTLDDLAAVRDLSYTLVDRNPGCLQRAVHSNRDRAWVAVRASEIRELAPRADLVCGFAVLKHFRLDEWSSLFTQLYGRARFGLFTVAIAPASVDDGLEFTHVRLSEQDLADTLKRAHQVELWRDWSDPEEPLIATRRAP